MKLVTRSFAAASTPCTEANLVTMKPCTPRNGTDGIAIPKVWCFDFLTASASVSSCENEVGTFASFVLTTRPMFSTAAGTPYSFLTAVPYENAFSVYDGKLVL